MTHIATHIRIFNLNPSDELVEKRTEAWLLSPTSEMHQLGIGDVSFIGRYETHAECIIARDRFRNSPDAYNPQIVFKCVDLRDNFNKDGG